MFRLTEDLQRLLVKDADGGNEPLHLDDFALSLREYGAQELLWGDKFAFQRETPLEARQLNALLVRLAFLEHVVNGPLWHRGAALDTSLLPLTIPETAFSALQREYAHCTRKYLLTGGAGNGKTAVLRVLFHEVQRHGRVLGLSEGLARLLHQGEAASIGTAEQSGSMFFFGAVDEFFLIVREQSSSADFPPGFQMVEVRNALSSIDGLGTQIGERLTAALRGGAFDYAHDPQPASNACLYTHWDVLKCFGTPAEVNRVADIQEQCVMLPHRYVRINRRIEPRLLVDQARALQTLLHLPGRNEWTHWSAPLEQSACTVARSCVEALIRPTALMGYLVLFVALIVSACVLWLSKEWGSAGAIAALLTICLMVVSLVVARLSTGHWEWQLLPAGKGRQCQVALRTTTLWGDEACHYAVEDAQAKWRFRQSGIMQWLDVADCDDGVGRRFTIRHCGQLQTLLRSEKKNWPLLSLAMFGAAWLAVWLATAALMWCGWAHW